ncbi:MAG: hypothetical protein A2X24_12495 [Chloroflexi bacterium GWB2_54_36]|nr:MAG: hypothetical protein A2X24_12495 [Chloroflexi bacterium GWB2_54_36]
MQGEQSAQKPRPQIMLRHVAVPNEHGSWVFLFSPLLIGLFAGGTFQVGSLLLVGAVLAAFMLRQPITILVKIISKRRPRTELPATAFWITIYGLIGLGFLTGLMAMGFEQLLFLAAPALPVFAWHLWLVSRRSERRQPIVEIAGSGVLALVAPAAYWVGVGHYDPTGWLLWGLTWLQAAVSIYYAYLRLEQRMWKSVPTRLECWLAGRKHISAAIAALILVSVLAVTSTVPTWVPLAYAIQLAETFWGTFNPAVKVKPTQIGIRQLIVSTLFTVAFIFAWG